MPELRGLTRHGNTLALMLDTDRFMTRAFARGDAVRARFGGDQVVLVRSPELTEQVLVSHGRSFMKDRITRDLAALLGEGLLVSDGEPWRRHRRLAQPAFHRERIAGYAGQMVETARRHAATWREGQAVDLFALLMRLTRDVVTATLLRGSPVQDADEFGEALETLMARYADWRHAVFPWLARLPLPENRRFAAARQRLYAQIDAVIAERRRSGCDDRGDLLGMLMAARDEDPAQMSDEQLRAEVLIFYLAGHETVAMALSWAFALLSRRPDAWDLLTREVDAVLGTRDATAEDVPKLVYTESVILESMRLYPPVWTIGREALEDVALDGLTLARGTQVWIVQWAAHRNPRYFPQPLAFLPERWKGDLKAGLPRFAYFPFGGGPRQCIGSGFAMLEAVLVLATLVQRWRPEIAPRDQPTPLFSITLRPSGPVRARLRAR
ncbi:Cytochrome P450 [Nannocystis exedens]|uniref:Cytochrome P450 n=1 Tax=Nannocystis exedens TaxID=54 RepID=A0A1I1XF62_9BACT|nr:Epi-isozizaene 5-monooxygenase/(E)-beta-farnesene synthase [Nannocystis exedens]SFE06044.1 Cytochrome P450 [Nannocystis exedens]